MKSNAKGSSSAQQTMGETIAGGPHRDSWSAEPDPIERVTLIDAAGQRLPASLIYSWDRSESAELPSEGLTFGHMARLILARRNAHRVILVRAGAELLFLCEVAHRWWDLTGAPVRVMRSRTASMGCNHSQTDSAMRAHAQDSSETPGTEEPSSVFGGAL